MVNGRENRPGRDGVSSPHIGIRAGNRGQGGAVQGRGAVLGGGGSGGEFYGVGGKREETAILRGVTGCANRRLLFGSKGSPVRIRAPRPTNHIAAGTDLGRGRARLRSFLEERERRPPLRRRCLLRVETKAHGPHCWTK